ncbi:hypothetical protein [Enterococcus sp. CSURQ0835]|nr:hypothetical protein [Enterococcus sp. CSURQ0835]
MKLSVQAPKFNYDLEVSGNQIRKTTIMVCGTILLGFAIKTLAAK